MPAMAEKEPVEMLACLGENLCCRRPGSNQIAHRFMTGIGDPDRGELAGAVQFGQHDSVAPIGLDPVAGFDRDQRWGTTTQPCPSPQINRCKP